MAAGHIGSIGIDRHDLKDEGLRHDFQKFPKGGPPQRESSSESNELSIGTGAGERPLHQFPILCPPVGDF